MAPPAVSSMLRAVFLTALASVAHGASVALTTAPIMSTVSASVLDDAATGDVCGSNGFVGFNGADAFLCHAGKLRRLITPTVPFTGECADPSASTSNVVASVSGNSVRGGAIDYLGNAYFFDDGVAGTLKRLTVGNTVETVFTLPNPSGRAFWHIFRTSDARRIVAMTVNSFSAVYAYDVATDTLTTLQPEGTFNKLFGLGSGYVPKSFLDKGEEGIIVNGIETSGDMQLLWISMESSAYSVVLPNVPTAFGISPSTYAYIPEENWIIAGGWIPPNTALRVYDLDASSVISAMNAGSTAADGTVDGAGGDARLRTIGSMIWDSARQLVIFQEDNGEVIRYADLSGGETVPIYVGTFVAVNLANTATFWNHVRGAYMATGDTGVISEVCLGLP